MRALYIAMLEDNKNKPPEQRATAPIQAVRLAEREQWVRDHPGWTYRDYDEAAIGDILFAREYAKITAECEKQAIAEAKQKQDGAAQ